MITEGQFTRELMGMDGTTLERAMKLMQKEYFKRFRNIRTSISLENGHTLVAEASYGDYPQIELMVDGSRKHLVLATEFQDEEYANADEPRFMTYFYTDDEDAVANSYSQDFNELMGKK